jgi:hypothetical protein
MPYQLRTRGQKAHTVIEANFNQVVWYARFLRFRICEPHCQQTALIAGLPVHLPADCHKLQKLMALIPASTFSARTTLEVKVFLEERGEEEVGLQARRKCSFGGAWVVEQRLSLFGEKLWESAHYIRISYFSYFAVDQKIPSILHLRFPILLHIVRGWRVR